VDTNEFGDQFAEISRNLEAMNRSMKDFTNSAAVAPNSAIASKRNSQVANDWL
jgi:hypothetical protein